MSPKKRSRSVGTRAKPTCWECGQTGHYSSSCPTLTEKLLKAARQTSSSAQIRQFLAKNSKASLLNLPMKRWRTLKRASGRRHFRAGPAGKNAQSKARKCRLVPSSTVNKEAWGASLFTALIAATTRMSCTGVICPMYACPYRLLQKRFDSILNQ